MKMEDPQVTLSYSQAEIIATGTLNLDLVHPSWKECVERGLLQVDITYLQRLISSHDWLPGPDKIFNAFSLPLNEVKYVLFGESPYPRHQSANGFAFWDASVKELWSETGLSKKVNRATSLRHILKMLLIAEGALKTNQLDQQSIAMVDKMCFVKTGGELFANFLRHGFLLLNTSLVFHPNMAPASDAKAWRPFIKELLACLIEKRPDTQFIFFGRIANTLDPLLQHLAFKKLCAEHPYNCSFPTNKKVINFFKPLHLLLKSNSL